MSWLGRRRTTLPLPPTVCRAAGSARLQPQPAPVPRRCRRAARDVPADVLVALESQLVGADEAPSAPDALVLDEMPFPALDLDAMQERYPLLRNAL